MDSDCETSSQPDTGYTDNSGANIPELLNNMVPIKYENDNWIAADISQEWYDYDSKEWANAVVLNKTKNVGDIVNEEDIDLWYVWIPRYKYKLFNAKNEGVPEQEIEIQFESGTSTTGTVKCTDNISGTDGTTSSQTCTNASNGAWYTHPAFTFGTQELKGFWVGKFEVSTTDSTCNNSPNTTNCNKNSHQVTIKPNVISLRYATASNLFKVVQNITSSYNLSGDSHMMKNMEWGAVAYLSHSKYGTCTSGNCVEIGINNNSNYITGCGATSGSAETTTCNPYNTSNGILASTTGNIYGIYDMSGGSWEYVMGNMVNTSGNFYSSSAGFSSALDLIYYDGYTYNTSVTTHGRGKLGDATKETLKTFGNNTGGWYSDHAYFFASANSWLRRGGGYAAKTNGGIFSFYNVNGSANVIYSTRAVLIK